jgi:hypothetical protein
MLEEAFLLRVLAGRERQRAMVRQEIHPELMNRPRRGMARQLQAASTPRCRLPKSSSRLLHGESALSLPADPAFMCVGVWELVGGILDGLHHRRMAVTCAAHRNRPKIRKRLPTSQIRALPCDMTKG